MTSIRKNSRSGSEIARAPLGLASKKSKTHSSGTDESNVTGKKTPRYVLLTRSPKEAEQAENKATSKEMTSKKTTLNVGGLAPKKEDGCCKSRTVRLAIVNFLLLLVVFCVIALVIWWTTRFKKEKITTVWLTSTTTTSVEPTSTVTTLQPTTTVYKYANVSVVNLTNHCLLNLTSKCHFYEHKYLTNCSQMICRSIGYTVGSRVTAVPSDGYNRTEATFTPFVPEPTPILVPNHAPCVLNDAIGRCIDGECQLTDLNLDIALRNYSNLAPQDGLFDVAESPSSWLPYDRDHCIDIDEVAKEPFKPLLTRKCGMLSDKHLYTCMLSKVFLRRCWAPLPSAGGAPCSENDLPIDFGQSCDLRECDSPNYYNASRINCINKTGFGAQPESHSNDSCLDTYKEDGIVDAYDFLPCCFRHSNETGICMAGHCLRKLNK